MTKIALQNTVNTNSSRYLNIGVINTLSFCRIAYLLIYLYLNVHAIEAMNRTKFGTECVGIFLQKRPSFDYCALYLKN
jgi:hypothetical protein